MISNSFFCNSFFFAKHLRISEKKCTFAAKKRTKQPIFLRKSGQNTIKFLGKSGQNKQNSMINRQSLAYPCGCHEIQSGNQVVCEGMVNLGHSRNGANGFAMSANLYPLSRKVARTQVCQRRPQSLFSLVYPRASMLCRLCR